MAKSVSGRLCSCSTWLENLRVSWDDIQSVARQLGPGL